MSAGAGRMELLSPAGNPQALERAVAAGADAVYLGCSAFSARAGAGNFNGEELREAVRFCHLHGVKVHVAVNTLVKDREIPALFSLLTLIRDAGADAVLVQDLGVLSLMRRCFPELTVHASTQMSLHNLTGVRWAARQGMVRVVLARECSLGEVKKAAEAGIEVEVFGHGAQCVCVSGQCLFSSLVGGRSGNRGRCAQPCRLNYGLEGEEGAWLSPRDVCLRDDLPALREAGVASVKLEGRLKSPAYVATVTESYRRGLDTMAPASKEEKEELLQAFQRGGFMRGFIMGCEDAGVIAPERVNHGGLPLGRVLRGDGRFAALGVDRPLHDGDQLRILTRRGDYETAYAGPEVPAAGTATLRLRPEDGGHVRPGDRVVRLSDSALNARALALPVPRIPLTLSLTALPGQPLMLLAFRDGLPVGQAAGEVVQAAQKRCVTAEEMIRQLTKTGDTPFTVRPEDCRVETEHAFVPLAALNALRRACLAAIGEKNDGVSPVPAVPEPEVGSAPRPLPDMAVSADPAALAALPEGTRGIWFPEDWREEALEAGLAGLPAGCWLQLPTVCEEATLGMIHRLAEAHRGKLGGVVLGSVGQLGLDWPVPVAAGSGIPVMNRHALAFLLAAGCRFVVASEELNREELRTLMAGNPPVMVPAWGFSQLMLLHVCPARTKLGLDRGHARCSLCDRGDPASLRGKTLTDRRGAAFPLRRLRLPEGCLVRVMNSLPLDIREEAAREGWPRLLRPDGMAEARGGPVTAGHWKRGVE
ncbi:MAG: U32 family peptidase [Clostridia bacterium]|nr:U32 family peptidase [Clostridia bacterium]